MFKLSIITVHLNDIEGLAQTQRSLDRILDSGSFEWIVVDGGSIPESDAQMRLFEKVRNSATILVSEVDHGIYDAMNKGTRLATGDYVLYLNAGDSLHPDFDLDRVFHVCESKKPGMIWGDSWDRNPKGDSYKRKTRKAFWLRYGMAVCHQAVFFRRDLLGDAPYDLRYRLAADYELLCREYRYGSGIEYVHVPVCIFDLVGESSHNQAETLGEESVIRVEYFGLPAFINRTVVCIKQSLWKFNTKFPRVRAAWRRWI